jgi:hypothetical protein
MVGRPIGAAAYWRPGTKELWFTTLPGGFATWHPAHGVATYDDTLVAMASPSARSWFTADGRRWFSWRRDHSGAAASVYLGDADAPAVAGLPINPSGLVTDTYWPIGDGRLLVQSWTTDGRRSDITLVDPELGTSRGLAAAGHLLAVGPTRALALLEWQLSRSSGRLTLVDYASGAQTVLADDVYAVDLDRARAQAGSDPLAPGTRIAFLSRNRLESRDDGLWVAELP